ncbi:MAG: hypothetical protein MK212_18820 [Saprospiraceae bacterium]|nr:hypothetical protein [Saprospiraceae bacterium]
MRVQDLRLYTHKLAEQKRFYTQRLGFSIVKETPSSFSIQIGYSRLTFINSQTEAYYHFALNIPPNQATEALEWLKTKQIPIEDWMGYELVDFSSWNAKAMYFYDASGNIVEFIARHNLKEVDGDCPFQAVHSLGISEVGMPVDKVSDTFQLISDQMGLEFFSGDKDRFCAVGDEEGLFIVVDKSQKTWIPNNEPCIDFPFDLELREGNRLYHLVYDNGLKIHTL